MPPVGHGDTLSHLVRLLDGAGHVVLVSGPPDSGKSTLLHALTEHATGAGIRVATAACSEPEQSLPLGVVGQLLQSVPAVESRAFPAISGALLRLAQEAPLLVIADDVQFADAESQQFLLHLVRRVRTAPVTVVLTGADGCRAPDPQFLAELSRQPHFTAVELGWLTGGDVERLLADRFGRDTATRIGPRAVALTAGNPLLVRAVVEDLAAAVAAGAPPEDGVAGPAFARAVVELLRRADPKTIRVAEGAAVLAELGTVPLLASLLELETDVVRPIVAALSRVGLLDGCELRPPSVQRALRSGLEDRQRYRLHRRAARMLHEQGAPAAAVTGHLVLAGAPGVDAGGGDWAASMLLEAAGRALAGDDVARAGELVELAGQHAAPGPARAAVTAQLAAVGNRVGPAAVERHLPALLAAARAGDLAAGAVARLVRSLLGRGRLREATEVVDLLRGLGVAGPAGSGPGADEVRSTRLWLASCWPDLAGRLPADDPGPRPPLAVNLRLQAATVLAVALDGPSGDGSLTAAVDGAEQVLQGSRLTDANLEAVEQALLTLILADRLDLAVRWCDPLLEATARSRAPWWRARLRAVRAEIALRQGDLMSALTGARLALATVPAPDWGTEIGAPLATRLDAATAIGLYDEAADLVALPVPEAMFESRHGVQYLRARGNYYLATGRPYAALGDFRACGALLSGWSLDVPALVPWRTDAARALLALDRREDARSLVTEQAALLGDGRPRGRGVTLRLLAATAEPAHRPQLLADAVEALQAAGDRLELARALGCLAGAYLDLGEVERARSVVQRALRIATECGAEPLRQELARATHRHDHPTARFTHLLPGPGTTDTCRAGTAPVRPADPADHGTEPDSADPTDAGRVPEGVVLSDAERRVAALAVRGRTNREIASRLYITVSTVEQHLTRVYRKLNVSRRGDLPDWLATDVADSA